MHKEPNVGVVVVSCTARFFTTVKICEVSELEIGDENQAQEKMRRNEEDLMGMLQEDEVLVAVLSPQFYARFYFVYDIKEIMYVDCG